MVLQPRIPHRASYRPGQHRTTPGYQRLCTNRALRNRRRLYHRRRWEPSVPCVSATKKWPGRGTRKVTLPLHGSPRRKHHGKFPNKRSAVHETVAHVATNKYLEAWIGKKDTEFTYTFENFFHPFVGELIEQLNRKSLAGLLDPNFHQSLTAEFFDYLLHGTDQ